MIFSLIKKVLDKTVNIEHWKLIVGGVVFIILSSFIIYIVEPNEFKSPLNGFWFVMTTISQVGFGDYIPKTMIGRLYTIVLYIVGVGFFAIIIAKWIDLLNTYEELKEAEILGYKGENHIVIITWSQKSKITIEQILNKNQNTDIVLIDQLNSSPINHSNIHYVQGDATKIDTLQKANILFANTVCVFASDNVIDKASEDGKILLIASTVKHIAKQNNKNIYTIVEILEEEHTSNTNQYFIDEFIISNQPFSTLMASKALHKER
ncbi:potassium channel family protein [Anaerobacillus sp. MEB173]|uniref:potassium channel family protein n=1 Tax=Anaerobacillus sp. MEB173 TaxID=3383345 RepID=UPI003F909C98